MTKEEFFKALHIQENITKRVRHYGGLINRIFIYDPGSLGEYVPGEIAGQCLVDKEEMTDEYLEREYPGAEVHVSIASDAKPPYIPVTSSELEAMYQQVVEKVGPVDMTDLGTIVTLR